VAPSRTVGTSASITRQEVGTPSLNAAQPYAKAEGRVFLLVLAYPGCHGTKAVKRLLLLLLYYISYKLMVSHFRSCAKVIYLFSENSRLFNVFLLFQQTLVTTAETVLAMCDSVVILEMSAAHWAVVAWG